MLLDGRLVVIAELEGEGAGYNTTALLELPFRVQGRELILVLG